MFKGDAFFIGGSCGLNIYYVKKTNPRQFEQPAGIYFSLLIF